MVKMQLVCFLLISVNFWFNESVTRDLAAWSVGLSAWLGAAVFCVETQTHIHTHFRADDVICMLSCSGGFHSDPPSLLRASQPLTRRNYLQFLMRSAVRSATSAASEKTQRRIEGGERAESQSLRTWWTFYRTKQTSVKTAWLHCRLCRSGTCQRSSDSGWWNQCMFGIGSINDPGTSD